MNGLFATLPTGTPTIAAESPGPGPADGPWQMMPEWGLGWGGGGMFLGPLFMVAWLAMLVALVVLLVRWLGGGSPGTGSAPRTAREILDERYAKGEIDHDEYEKRRKTLGT